MYFAQSHGQIVEVVGQREVKALLAEAVFLQHNFSNKKIESGIANQRFTRTGQECLRKLFLLFPAIVALDKEIGLLCFSGDAQALFIVGEIDFKARAKARYGVRESFVSEQFPVRRNIGDGNFLFAGIVNMLLYVTQLK